ncbi:uncharacterized protein PV09_07083 [Verruconis gallopava]|uniref:Major facilitator superfamily (MFS) profile domain-containing protein n=1 Tax=Verruconis gallopava TaxID=253628 RepID=A0A0D1YLB9_9PEZI|nr:uncharacterized protein PV09_07083 [Verruconis gallopava]KIW01612.1 hypothetical protein PV09_07083 [Verruconis gallopava]
MAAPEIAPRDEEERVQGTRRGNNPGNSDSPSLSPPTSPQSGGRSERSPSPWDKDEKQPNVNDDCEEQDDWPIAYHYLTFETELPHPISVEPRTPEAPHPPPPPDLAKYTSPFLWPDLRKRIIIWISVFATAFTAFTAGAYSPALQQMKDEWHVSTVAILCGITTFTTGFGVAPMVLAPFSEINGRKPVFIASGLLFVVCQLCCAVTRSYGGMLVARFFVGVGGSTFSTMVGGVISDIYHTAERNTPMTLFSAGALVGTGMGPFVTGFVAQHLHWRWMFWIQVIMDAVLMVVVIVCFKETRGSVLLSRKAKALNAWYEEREKAGYYGFKMPVPGATDKFEPQRIRWKVKSDEERASLSRMIAISCYRPFHLLITEPVVFFFSLWVSFAWAVLYLTFAAIPLVFSTEHGFDIQQNGYVFTSISIASVIFAVICIYQEKIAKRYNKLPPSPEARLYFSCYESVLLPVGLFMFGWTSNSSVHWIAPAIAIGLATMGIFSVYLAVFNYLADTYHRYASSALAAQSCCRNIMGGVLPLVTNQMFTHLTYGPASSLLGGIGILLTFVPWVLMLWGPRIRARSKFASELVG